MDWMQILVVVGSNAFLFGAMIAIVVVLHVHSDKKMHAALKAISEEMKDFHSRLCIIEERSKRKIF